jgi:hypothetical protein
VGWQFELTTARLEAEIAWCDRVAGRLESGVTNEPCWDAESDVVDDQSNYNA